MDQDKAGEVVGIDNLIPNRRPDSAIGALGVYFI